MAIQSSEVTLRIIADNAKALQSLRGLSETFAQTGRDLQSRAAKLDFFGKVQGDVASLGRALDAAKARFRAATDALAGRATYDLAVANVTRLQDAFDRARARFASLQSAFLQGRGGETARAKMAELDDEIARLGVSLGRAKAKAAEFQAGLNGAKIPLESLRQEHAAAAAQIRSTENALAREQAALQRVSAELKTAGVDTTQLAAAQQRLAAQAAQAAAASTAEAARVRATRRVDAAAAILGFDPGQAAKTEQEVARLRAAFSRLFNEGKLGWIETAKAAQVLQARITELRGAHLPSLSNAVTRVQTTFFALRTAFLGLLAVTASTGAAGRNLSLAVEFDSLNRQLTFITGSAPGAAQAMAFVRAEADRLGLNVLQAAKSYSQLAAATKGTQLEGEETRRLFSAMSGAAVVLGLSSERVERAFYAFGQMASKGSVQMEELRGQLGDQLYGAFLLAANSIGMTTERLTQLLSVGGLPAYDFLRYFTREIERQFGSAIPNSVNGARAAFARFSNAWMELQLAFANGGFLDLAVEVAQKLTALFKDPEFINGVRSFGAALKNIFDYVISNGPKVLAVLGALAGVTLGAKIGSIFGTYGAGIGSVIGLIAGGTLGYTALGVDNRQKGTEKDRLLSRLAVGYVAGHDANGDPIRRQGVRLDPAMQALAQNMGTVIPPGSRNPNDLPPYSAPGQNYDKFAVARLHAMLDAQIRVVKEKLEQQQANLDYALSQGIETYRRYYDQKSAIEVESFQQEISSRRRELEEINRQIEQIKPADPAKASTHQLEAYNSLLEKRYKVESDIETLVLKQRNVGVEAMRALSAATIAWGEALAGVKAKLSALGGDSTTEREVALNQELNQLRQEASRNGGAGSDEIDRYEAAARADLALSRIEDQVRLQQSLVELRKQAADLPRGGVFAGAAAQAALSPVYRQFSADLTSEIADAQEQVNEATLDPEVRDRLNERIAQLQLLRAQTDQLIGPTTAWGVVLKDIASQVLTQLSDGLASAFSSMIEGTKSAGDAFKEFGIGVLKALEQIIVKLLIIELLNAAISGATGGKYGFDATGLLKRADGGYISGPGGPTDDRIPALLSNGEYVINAGAVKRFGKSFFDALNGGMLPRSPAQAFASGGYAGRGAAVASGGFAGIDVQINNYGKEPVTAQSGGRGPDGREILRIVIGELSRDVTSNGPFARTLSGAYGLRRAAVTR